MPTIHAEHFPMTPLWPTDATQAQKIAVITTPQKMNFTFLSTNTVGNILRVIKKTAETILFSHYFCLHFKVNGLLFFWCQDWIPILTSGKISRGPKSLQMTVY